MRNAVLSIAICLLMNAGISSANVTPIRHFTVETQINALKLKVRKLQEFEHCFSNVVPISITTRTDDPVNKYVILGGTPGVTRYMAGLDPECSGA